MTSKQEWTVSEDGRGRYSLDLPYVMRDQGLRAADDMVRVVLWDIADVLSAGGYGWLALYAACLAAEAESLPWNEARTWVLGMEGYDDILHGLLEDAEQIPGISVQWYGDIGTVWVTLADGWEWLDEDLPGGFNDEGEYTDDETVRVDW